MHGTVAPGLQEPALAAQRHFRAVLDAVARPGRAVELEGHLPPAPAGLLPSTYALLLALADFETPVWLAPGVDSEIARASLRFHAGCPIVPEPAQAAFAVAGSPAEALPLARFAVGTPEFPDRSTTVLIQCGEEGGTAPARLSGPGLERPLVVALTGPTAAFWADASANAALFPRGVDIVLAWSTRRVGVPRSTRIEVL